VEVVGFVVAEEVVLQCQPCIAREVVLQIHDLMTLSIRFQVGTLTYVVSRSTWSERE
jgi:hypothetical protein